MKNSIWMATVVCAWIIIIAFPLSVNAQNGGMLEITMQSDKKTYEIDEKAKLTVTVENKGDTIATDVVITNILPNGLMYAPEQNATIFEHEAIQPHASVKHEIWVQKAEDDLPQTGDTFKWAYVWCGIVIGGLILVGAQIVKMKKCRI